MTDLGRVKIVVCLPTERCSADLYQLVTDTNDVILVCCAARQNPGNEYPTDIRSICWHGARLTRQLQPETSAADSCHGHRVVCQLQASSHDFTGQRVSIATNDVIYTSQQS